MKPVVRAAREADLDGVLAIEREATTAPHWTREAYERMLRADDSPVRRCFLVAETERQLAGFAVGSVVGDEAELESIAVRTGARRMGVGSALLEAVQDWCRSNGAAVLLLEVRRSSQGAQQLYAGAGFRVTGIRPEYYSKPVEDAVCMCCELKVESGD